MEEYNTPVCDECTEELIELSGEFHCPQCDSLSGFTLVPDENEFAL